MATTQAAPPKAAIDYVSYEDLYQRWEKGNWSAYELDFAQDRIDWHETFGDTERRGALWNYAMFFHGEDSVTDNLGPYIDAAPREEQKYFLATQQVDEARHTIFFSRFMQEVVEAGRGSVAGSLAATRPELTWGFKKTFEHLDKVADGLRRDRSKPNLAAAITMYHLVVEATLAQPGQHFIESYLAERGVLPAFHQGMENIARDEQRHIGFGVKLLSDLVSEDPECKHAVADLLREIMPVSVATFVPPNWDASYVEVFGSTIEDVYVHGMDSLEQRLRAAGLPFEDLPGAPVVARGLTNKERVERAMVMLRASYLGEKTGPPSKDPAKMEVMFDTVGRSVDTTAVPSGTVLQWDFSDAEPFFLRVENGATTAARGRVESPDLTFKCRFEDWVDITAGRTDPRIAMATGKVKPRGSFVTLWRTKKLFGR